LDGNIFFEEHGIPILKIDLKSRLLAEALPVPLAVAIQMFRSLMACMVLPCRSPGQGPFHFVG
jgi:hypothetical protein